MGILTDWPTQRLEATNMPWRNGPVYDDATFDHLDHGTEGRRCLEICCEKWPMGEVSKSGQGRSWESEKICSLFLSTLMVLAAWESWSDDQENQFPWETPLIAFQKFPRQIFSKHRHARGWIRHLGIVGGGESFLKMFLWIASFQHSTTEPWRHILAPILFFVRMSM